MEKANGRILLVDDEPALLKMMGAYLNRRGFQVATADTTETAWSLVASAPSDYSVVVLDATMSGLSMEELASRMLAASPSLSLIAASGYPVDMGALEALAPGRVMFLHKPFPPEMLAAAIRRMIATPEENL